MAPLQKRAWYGLAIGVIFAIALLVVFIVKGGISTFNEDTGFRIIIDILWVGGLVANLIIVNLTLRKRGMVDERIAIGIAVLHDRLSGGFLSGRATRATGTFPGPAPHFSL